MQGRAPHHAGRPAVRGRGRRGAAPSCSSAPGGRWRPGWARSGSTRASGSARRPPTTCRCCATCAGLVEAAAGAGCAGVLVGTSRKRFLGVLAAEPGAHGAGAGGRPGRGIAGHGGRSPGGGGRHGAGPRRGGHGADGTAVWSCRMKGKWAAGIPPRNFTWVITDHLAVSERPGGFAVNHRRVRRQEEIIWLRVQGFGRVISLLPSPAQPGRLRRGGAGLGPLPARAHRGPPARPGRLLPGHRRLPGRRACGSWCTRTSWATGSWACWPGTWSGRSASATSPRPWRWSSTSWGTPWASPGRELLSELEGMPVARPGCSERPDRDP